MELLEQTLEMKWPILLFEFIFLLGGIVIILVSLYLLFMTFIFGINS